MSGQTSFPAPSAGASSSSQMHLQPHQTGSAPNAIYANYPNYSHLYVETFKFLNVFLFAHFCFPHCQFLWISIFPLFLINFMQTFEISIMFLSERNLQQKNLSVPKNVEPLPKFVNVFKSILDDFKLTFFQENKIPRLCSYWLNIDFNNLVKK